MVIHHYEPECRVKSVAIFKVKVKVWDHILVSTLSSALTDPFATKLSLIITIITRLLSEKTADCFVQNQVHNDGSASH